MNWGRFWGALKGTNRKPALFVGPPGLDTIGHTQKSLNLLSANASNPQQAKREHLHVHEFSLGTLWWTSFRWGFTHQPLSRGVPY